MALRVPPSWQQNASHPSENDRLTAQAVWTASGIIGSTSLAVSASSPAAMSVQVATGWAAIVGNSTTNMGVYQIYNDASTTLSVAAADPTNPRIDRVVATIRDAYYSGANNDVIFQVLTGTPAGSPVAPTTPSNSISLATLAVSAAATQIVAGNITDTRTAASYTNLNQPTFIGASAGPSGSNSIANNTYQAVSFTNESFDTNDFHSNTTNTTRFTIPIGRGGYYLFVTTISMDNTGNAGSARQLRFYKNGSFTGTEATYPIFSGNSTTLFASVMLNLAAGDYIEVYVWQNSGSARSLSGSNYCSVEYVGA